MSSIKLIFDGSIYLLFLVSSDGPNPLLTLVTAVLALGFYSFLRGCPLLEPTMGSSSLPLWRKLWGELF